MQTTVCQSINESVRVSCGKAQNLEIVFRYIERILK